MGGPDHIPEGMGFLERSGDAEPFGVDGSAEMTGIELPGSVVVRPDEEDVLTALGSDLLIHALNCVRMFGDFHLAVSGGSTPAPFYRRLMVDPMFRPLPWKRTHLWIVDERRVSFEDERSNFGQIRELLVEHSDIPKAHVHPIHALRDDAAETYEAELKEALAWREKGQDRLDCALLGMGADGHTASLFPNSPALDERRRYVRVNDGPSVTPPERVTMTYPLLNAARLIAVLVMGEGKREALARLTEDGASAERYPILGVHPIGGELRWYLDSAAVPVSEG